MISNIDSRLKQIFRSSSLFGGKSIVVFGDLRQLSHVGDRWVFQPSRSDVYGIVAGSPLWKLFKFFPLTQIMRQRDDLSFASALNHMAIGQMTNNDIELLKSRECKTESVPRDAIHLFKSNKEVDDFNMFRLNLIPSDPVYSEAVDKIKGPIPEISRNNILRQLALLKVSETVGLPSNILFKVTAKYMVTVNVGTADGLVNGATGVLMDIEFGLLGNNNQIPIRLWIHFEEPSVGRNARSRRSHSFNQGWSPIEKYVKSFQYKSNDQVLIERSQFPVVPAEAITIHKSQGSTYFNVSVHIKRGMTRADLYVACSRATKATGLYLIGKFSPPNAPPASDRVSTELDLLHSEKLLKLHFKNLMQKFDSKFSVLYHNMQSLHKHIEDVKCNNLVLSVDILCFVETWTCPTDIYNLDNYSIFARLDGSDNSRKPNGIICFANVAIFSSINPLKIENICIRNNYLQFVLVEYQHALFLILYKSPNFPKRRAAQEIYSLLREHVVNNRQIVVMGDFNENLSIHAHNVMSNKHHDLSLRNLLDQAVSTTNCNTQIDWCFSNLDSSVIHVDTHEQVFSFHDALQIVVKTGI